MTQKFKLQALCLTTLIGSLGLAGCSDPGAPAPDATAAAAPAADATAAPAATAAATPSLDALQGLKVEDFGPKNTKAGQAFNEQPDGSSAIWVRADRNLEGYDAAVWFNGQRLGSRGISARTVSGTIPAELLAKAGTYSVEIRIGADGAALASDKVDFVVQ